MLLPVGSTLDALAQVLIGVVIRAIVRVAPTWSYRVAVLAFVGLVVA
jgi:TRAP-type C4-dicarboxylate transport system permease small subunit